MAGHIKARLALRSSAFSHHAGIPIHAPKRERTAYGPANAWQGCGGNREAMLWHCVVTVRLLRAAGLPHRRTAYGRCMGNALLVPLSL